jgi:hypothetical protein
MAWLPNVPGPGEQADPEYLQAEAADGLIPDGEMPGLSAAMRSRPLPAAPAIGTGDADDLASRDPQIVLRRSGTDRQRFPAVQPEASVAETRLDGSGADLPHEAVIDPAQDNAGLQPDLL